MTDFRLVPVNLENIRLLFDWATTPAGLIDETMELASAVLIALGTDATAGPNDKLPDPRSNDRRGWWGDMNADVIWGAWPVGSKLWLLQRDKIVGSAAQQGATTTRVSNYISAAIQPFVDNGICSKFTIDKILVDPDQKRIDAVFTMYRGPLSAVQLTYQPLWHQIFPGA